MTDKEFDVYFSRLEKVSDSTRSIIYVFIVVYLALLMYALQTFGYPAREFTYENILLQAKCRYDSNRTSTCEPLLKDILDQVNIPPALKDDLEKDFWEHKLQRFYDDSVAQRTFQFPVFGATTDRDLMWLIFPLPGVIAYLIILFALRQRVATFRFIMNKNKNDPLRLRLILSTLMLSSLNAEFNPIVRTVWYAAAAFIVSMPIIVCALTIFDQIDGIAWIRQGHPNWELWQSSGFVLRFEILLVFLGLQGILFASLITLLRAFGRHQREAQSLVASLDPIDPGPQR